MCNFKQFGDEQQNTSGFSGFTVSAALDMMRHNILISRLRKCSANLDVREISRFFGVMQ